MESSIAALISKFFEYGGVAGVLALVWWKAEQRADKAQSLADQRADAMTKLFVDQVQANEKVVTAIAVQNTTLDRMSAYLDRVGEGK